MENVSLILVSVFVVVAAVIAVIVIILMLVCVIVWILVKRKHKVSQCKDHQSLNEVSIVIALVLALHELSVIVFI